MGRRSSALSDAAFLSNAVREFRLALCGADKRRNFLAKFRRFLLCFTSGMHPRSLFLEVSYSEGDSCVPLRGTVVSRSGGKLASYLPDLADIETHRLVLEGVVQSLGGEVSSQSTVPKTLVTAPVPFVTITY